LKIFYIINRKIIEKPTLLETFSYIFYYPTSLIGPSFEFADFRKFINLEAEYKEIPMLKCLKHSLKQLSVAVFYQICFVAFLDKLNPHLVLTEDYSSKSFLYKFTFYMLSTAFNIRAKYYSGFKMSEASVIFCGLSYEKKEVILGSIEKQDEAKTLKSSESNSILSNGYLNNEIKNNNFITFEESFSKVNNMDILKFEFDVNPIAKINSWNVTVHKWLKYQVFLRLINVEIKLFKNNKSLASMITFLISAVWHGFYPVYYVLSIHFYMIEQTSKTFEDKLLFFSKLRKKNFIIRYIFNFILMGVICFLGMSFSLLTISNIFKFYSDFYFIPNAIVIILYFYSVYFIRKPRENKIKDN